MDAWLTIANVDGGNLCVRGPGGLATRPRPDAVRVGEVVPIVRVDDCEAWTRELVAQVDGLAEDRVTRNARIHTLEAALRTYGTHLNGCALNGDPEDVTVECDCGFAAVLDGGLNA